MIRIEELGIDQVDIVFKMVDKLLHELGENDGNPGATCKNRRVMEDWKANPGRFSAFAAFAEYNEPVGLITLVECFAVYAGGNYGIINELYVSPPYRSKGVGKQLLDKVKETAKQKNWPRIEVVAPLEPKWGRTVRFYEREQFTHAGPKLKYKV